MAKTLVAAPEAWATPRGKLRRPTEWIVASLRRGQVSTWRIFVRSCR